MELELARADLYIKEYLENLKFGAGFPVTELQPADDLAILAGIVLVNVWKTSGEEKYLNNAAAFLEFAMAKSQQSFQMRLLLIRIYRLMGRLSIMLSR